MKLIRYGDAGQEKPGLVDTNGTIRDLSAHVGDITGAALDKATLDRLRGLDAASLPAVDDAVSSGCWRPPWPLNAGHVGGFGFTLLPMKDWLFLPFETV